jgi:hypothetical protein
MDFPSSVGADVQQREQEEELGLTGIVLTQAAASATSGSIIIVVAVAAAGCATGAS